jgi:hypothetical protein
MEFGRVYSPVVGVTEEGEFRLLELVGHSSPTHKMPQVDFFCVHSQFVFASDQTISQDHLCTEIETL